ncbi:MAG: MFS transporter [Myxococcota bacterium]
MSRPAKLFWLGSLYLTQGLPFGVQARLPEYLRASGMDLASLGFLGLLALPWLLKVLWAPAVDATAPGRLGRRRRWILPLQLCTAAVCAVAAFVPPEANLPLLLGLVFLLNFFTATLDVAVDGLAVDLLSPEELGAGNAAQVVGFKVGGLLGGGLLSWLAEQFGWAFLFLSVMALVLLGFAITLAFREPRGAATPAVEEPPRQALVAMLRGLFATRGGVLVLAIVATYKLGEKMADGLWGPFLVDAGWTPGELGLLRGTWGMGASIAGSLLGGWLAGRLALRVALLVAGTLRLVPLALQLGVTLGLADAAPGALAVAVATLAEAFGGGVLTTVLFAFMMSRADRRVGATSFTLFAVVEVLGKFPADPIAGLLAARAGYAPAFALALGLSLLWLALPALYRGPKRGLSASPSTGAGGAEAP